MNKRASFLLGSLTLLGIVIAVLFFRRDRTDTKSSNAVLSNPQVIHEVHVSIDAHVNCATVENKADDNVSDDQCSALACSQNVIASAVKKSVPYHDRNSTAITNLNSCLGLLQQPGSGMIVGHGDTALINTGKGADATDALDRRITPQNPDKWEYLLRTDLGDQHKTQSLTLLGCSTGAGQASPSFLDTIRTDSAASIVKAPTKDVFCDGQQLYFMNSAGWLTVPQAQLSQSMAALFPTTASSFVIRSLSADGKVSYSPVHLENVIPIGAKLYDSAESPEIPLSAAMFTPLLNNIDYSEILEDSGCPLSRKTGYLRIRFTDPKAEPQIRILTIFNNGLLHDTSQHDVQAYYRTSPAFLGTFRGLFLNPN